MAATPQPRALASTVSAFGSFDEAHGFAVTLFAVVALAAIGGAFLWGGRALCPALITLVVVGLADWVLIEDFAVWGGTGTDPTTRVPAPPVRYGSPDWGRGVMRRGAMGSSTGRGPVRPRRRRAPARLSGSPVRP